MKLNFEYGGLVAAVMTYSHCTGPGPGPGQIQEMGKELMGSNILYRSVHTGMTLGHEPDPLSSVVPVPFSVPVPCSVKMSHDTPCIRYLSADTLVNRDGYTTPPSSSPKDMSFSIGSKRPFVAQVPLVTEIQTVHHVDQVFASRWKNQQGYREIFGPPTRKERHATWVLNWKT